MLSEALKIKWRKKQHKIVWNKYDIVLWDVTVVNESWRKCFLFKKNGREWRKQQVVLVVTGFLHMETHFIVMKECHYYTRETENTLLSTVFVFRKECEKKNWISILWSSCTCQSCVLAHKIQKGVKILQMALFSLIGFSAVWYVEYAIVFSVWILTILTQYCEYLRRILQLLCVCLCHWLNSWTVTCVWETFQNLIY